MFARSLMRRSNIFPEFYTASCKTNGSEKPVLRSEPRKAALDLTTGPCSSIPHLQQGPLDISREVWKKGAAHGSTLLLLSNLQLRVYLMQRLHFCP